MGHWLGGGIVGYISGLGYTDKQLMISVIGHAMTEAAVQIRACFRKQNSAVRQFSMHHIGQRLIADQGVTGIFPQKQFISGGTDVKRKEARSLNDGTDGPVLMNRNPDAQGFKTQLLYKRHQHGR